MIKEGYRALQPMYAMLAQQFVDDYNLMDGVALDIGTGHGSLGVELAKITNMKMIFLDIDEKAIEEAKENFKESLADNESDFIVSPVEKINLPDESVDFIMSRGSIFFWNDIEFGLEEVQRILKPGGVAVVGGGLGRYIPDTMRKKMWEGIHRANMKQGRKKPPCIEFMSIVNDSNIKNARIFDDGEGKGGRWLEIRKG